MPIQAANPWISHSDLWSGSSSLAYIDGSLMRLALAGITAIEAAGGPVVPWQPGRTDYNDASAAEEHRGQIGDRRVINQNTCMIVY
jgi:cytochrome c peroxidase